MSIFDIDENINDPWAGLRDTEAYVDYVLEEAQRLYDGGELEETPQESDMLIIFSEIPEEIFDYENTTYFIYDGRKFAYLYYRNTLAMYFEGKEQYWIAVYCKEWEKAKWSVCVDGKIERRKSY